MTASRLVGSCASRMGRPPASTVETTTVPLCGSMPECSIEPPGEGMLDRTAHPELSGNIKSSQLTKRTGAPRIARDP